MIFQENLTYGQKMRALALKGEESYSDFLSLDSDVQSSIDQSFFDNLGEGTAPYRPRYILPRYDLLIKKGSSFLGLPVPQSLSELIHTLLIFYHYVPSITSYPVYFGELDQLFEPYLTGDREKDLSEISFFLRHLDRVFPSGFSHANLGPTESRAALLFLEAEKQLKNAVPNLTLKYDLNQTSDSYALKAIEASLECSRPAFANHLHYSHVWGEQGYGLASCYNALPLGGGSFTLMRLNLAQCAKRAKTLDQLLKDLPSYMTQMINVMEQRADFIIHKTHFFKNNFLVEEGFIDLSSFIMMFGLFGMAEATEVLSGEVYGKSQRALEMAHILLQEMEAILQRTPSRYRFLLHAQSGITTDVGATAGCRIPPGKELELCEHLNYTSPLHRYFPTGVSDIFCFEKTAKKNPQALLDIMKGAFRQGSSYLAFYSSDSDLIRITGYLVKKSEIEQLKKGHSLYSETAPLGKEAVAMAPLLERKEQKL